MKLKAPAAAVAAFFLSGWLPSEGIAERRTALVIGNASYKSSPLKNAANDAKDMASALRGLGFDVIHKNNITHRSMVKAVHDFGKRLQGGGVGLFYYAGHGVQVDGQNYLIPLKAQIESAEDVEFVALDVGRVLAKMEAAGNSLNILILDACRDNPFRGFFRSGSRGLARTDAPRGTIVAYATAPGSVAADGSGSNGMYTKHLLKEMRVPGQKIEDVFKQVRIGVVEESGGKQTPWDSSSLMGQFYFKPTTRDRPGPGSDPKLPTDSTVDLESLEQEATRIEVAMAAWAIDLSKMRGDYNRALKLEKRGVPGTLKVKAWKKFLVAHAGDNPYSEEDEVMRQGARKKMSAWERQPLPREREPAKKRQNRTGSRFKANPDGTVFDRALGLTWYCPDDRKTYTLKEARLKASQLRLRGLPIWRLPREAEIESLGQDFEAALKELTGLRTNRITRYWLLWKPNRRWGEGKTVRFDYSGPLTLDKTAETDKHRFMAVADQ